jgi:hypothetical protein
MKALMTAITIKTKVDKEDTLLLALSNVSLDLESSLDIVIHPT